MDVKDLKLTIINRIVATEDITLLNTILQLLERNTASFPYQKIEGKQEETFHPVVQEFQQEMDHLFVITGQ